MTADANLIDVKGLKVSFRIPGGSLSALRGVSFRIRPGSIVAVVANLGLAVTAPFVAEVELDGRLEFG